MAAAGLGTWARARCGDTCGDAWADDGTDDAANSDVAAARLLRLRGSGSCMRPGAAAAAADPSAGAGAGAGARAEDAADDCRELPRSRRAASWLLSLA